MVHITSFLLKHYENHSWDIPPFMLYTFSHKKKNNKLWISCRAPQHIILPHFRLPHSPILTPNPIHLSLIHTISQFFNNKSPLSQVLSFLRSKHSNKIVNSLHFLLVSIHQITTKPSANPYPNQKQCLNGLKEDSEELSPGPLKGPRDIINPPNLPPLHLQDLQSLKLNQ